MSSIKDVARTVGVSTATVSRALRGLPRVSNSTRDRVLQAAAELDYVASPSAAGLAGGRTRAVGVVVPFVSRWFFASVVQGAEAPLREAGYDLLLYNLGGDVESRDRVFASHLLRRRVDAVLVLSLTPSTQEIAELVKLKRPVALVGATVPGWSSVRIDDIDAACTAMRHLIALGHRRIAYIGGPPAASHSQARLHGYRAAMEAEGIHIPEGYVRAGQVLYQDGIAGAAALLDLPEPPTAIFAGSDETAVGVIESARTRGLRVPEDLSVVGFDDTRLARFVSPPLTTVRQPLLEMGGVALRTALRLAAGEKLDSHHVELATQLVVRHSTAHRPDEHS